MRSLYGAKCTVTGSGKRGLIYASRGYGETADHIGFAVRADRRLFSSDQGRTSRVRRGDGPHHARGRRSPADTYGQARRVLAIMLAALEEAGARPEDVVRTRTYLTPAADFREAARAHGELFGEIRPASTMIVVSGFLDPRWLIEMEAQALIEE